jgi:TRAP-type C4-dicarboxylate transport system substrate-binding protein
MPRFSTRAPRIASLVAALSLAAAFAAPAGAQETIKMTVASGHPPILLWVKTLRETFLPTVDAELAKTGKYKMQWNEAYGGTIAKLGSELETMQQGVSDMGIVATVFHSAKMPLNNATWFVPFGPSDARVVTQAFDYVQGLPELQAEWNKYNLVYLAGFTFENYNLLSTQPLDKIADFKGRKVGAAGPNLNWIKNTGAVGVQGTLNTFYNDLKNGVYDSAIIFSTAAIPTKLFEVAPRMTVANFGAMHGGAVAINKNRWDRMPEEVKQAFRKAGNAYKAAYLKELDDRIAAAQDTWKKSGGTIVQMSDAERSALIKSIPNPTVEWLKQAEKNKLPAKKVMNEYMQAVRATGFAFPRDWDKAQ